MKLNIPEKIKIVLRELESAGHEAFLVGGSVRDLLQNNSSAGGPKDWDITTSAKPKEILKVFPDAKYENDFGTVILPEKYIKSSYQLSELGSQSNDEQKIENKEQGARNKKQTSSKLQNVKRETEEKNANINHKLITDNCESNVEITTYRIESTYSDNRRPDEIKFAKTLEEDLGRRDFTCNAIALQVNFEFPILNFDSNSNETILNNKKIGQKEHDKKENPYLKNKTLKNSNFNQNSKFKIQNYKIIDLFNGQQDIKNRVIRAVGDANERFNEDALRMMRAVRFAAQLSTGDDLEFLKKRKGEGNQNQKTEYQVLKHKKQDTSTKLQTNHNNQDTKLQTETTKITNRNQSKNKELSSKTLNNSKFNKNSKFKIENLSEARWWIGERTFQAIKDNAHLLKHISPERISDEFQKIILSNRPAWGVELLVETGLMKYIIPEVLDTIGVRQNRHHYNGPYNTVYKHMLAALKTCPSKKIEVRLAAFFHDIGKPKSKRGHGYNATFYGHEYIGARMTKKIMERLKFPRKVIDKTVLLVKNHMFYYNTDEVGEKGVRKVIRKVGLENINDLIDVRIGDRLGSGVAKAVPYKLRHFKYMVEKVSKDPISVKDLKINGDILLADYNFKPGPQMGAILEILLAEVLDDPKKNTLEYLANRAIELQKEDLQQLRTLAKNKIKEEKQQEEQQTKGKYWVK